jgi:hypothetical protein
MWQSGAHAQNKKTTSGERRDYYWTQEVATIVVLETRRRRMDQGCVYCGREQVLKANWPFSQKNTLIRSSMWLLREFEQTVCWQPKKLSITANIA